MVLHSSAGFTATKVTTRTKSMGPSTASPCRAGSCRAASARNALLRFDSATSLGAAPGVAGQAGKGYAAEFSRGAKLI